jgi:hypothetical protein
MKAYRGNIGIAPPILNLGTRWGVVLYTQKEPQPLNRKVSGPHRQLLTFWIRENLLILLGIYQRGKETLKVLFQSLFEALHKADNVFIKMSTY